MTDQWVKFCQGFFAVLEREEARYKIYSETPEEQIEGEAEAKEIGEAVIAGGVNHGVGLITNRGGEAGGGGEGYGDEKRPGVDAESGGGGDGDGRE